MTNREQLAEAFNELLNTLEERAKEASNNYVEEDEEEEQCTCTPLERLINNLVNKHLENGTFPTLEEAQTIHILDFINSKYN